MELWGRYKWPSKSVFLKLFHPEINGVITYNHTFGGFRRWREAFCRFFSRLQHGLLHRSDAKLPSLVLSWRKAPIQNGYHLWKKEEKANKQQTNKQTNCNFKDGFLAGFFASWGWSSVHDNCSTCCLRFGPRNSQLPSFNANMMLDNRSIPDARFVWVYLPTFTINLRQM